MTISKDDLFLAILSMDSYNRGYNSGVGGTDGLGSVLGTQIGNATIIRATDSDDGSPERDAGFYAVAYEWKDQTVISYRGTDNIINFNPWGQKPGGDFWNAYLQGLGSDVTDQAVLAANFFQEVTGTTNGLPSQGKAILTGHSLGGGLAGFVASLYGQEGYLFDNMAFELAATRAFKNSKNVAALDELFFNGLAPKGFKIGDNLHAFAVKGEFLSFNRTFQDTPETWLESHWNGGRFALHSQALQVSLMFAQESQHTQWMSIGDALWSAAFDPNVALAAGFAGAGTDGRYGPADKMMTAIAYSAIAEGERPYGDVAIRALFNDADRLGSIVDDLGKKLVKALPLACAQFAGEMANYDVQWNTAHLKLSAAIAGKLKDVFGIVQISSEGNLLTVDLSDALWGIGSNPVTIVGEDKISAAAHVNSALRDSAVMAALTASSFTEEDIQRFHIELGAQATNINLNKLVVKLQDDSLGIFVDTDHMLEQTITGTYGNDFIIVDGATVSKAVVGGNGYDILIGGAASDKIDGGNGNDIVVGGLGADQIFGGVGNDTFHLGSADYVPGETISGGDGVDEIVLTDAGSFNLRQEDAFGVAGTTVSNVERLIGSSSEDILVGSSNIATYLDGGEGIDTVYGGTGADTLVGRNAGDVLVSGGGRDHFILYDPNVVLDLGSNDAVLIEADFHYNATLGHDNFDFKNRVIYLTLAENSSEMSINMGETSQPSGISASVFMNDAGNKLSLSGTGLGFVHAFLGDGDDKIEFSNTDTDGGKGTFLGVTYFDRSHDKICIDNLKGVIDSYADLPTGEYGAYAARMGSGDGSEWSILNYTGDRNGALFHYIAHLSVDQQLSATDFLSI